MSRYRFVVPVLLSLGAVGGPSAAFGQMAIGVDITIAPPALPVYVQPPLPADGYIWVPGYWAYGPDGLLLGARHLGTASRGRFAVDAGLVGLEQRGLSLQRGLLGTGGRLLRWHQLRLRLRRRGLPGRLLEPRQVPLQPRGQQLRRYARHQRLQSHDHQQHHGACRASMAARAASPRVPPRNSSRISMRSTRRSPACRPSTSRPPAATMRCWPR